MAQHSDPDNGPPPTPGFPSLRPTTVRPGAAFIDPGDSILAVERLAVLTHELGNLLDGSMRCLGLARRSLGPDAARTGDANAEVALRQIDTVYHSMERMADLVHTAMLGSVAALGSAKFAQGRPVMLAEAIGHAIEVVSPQAAEGRISISVGLAEELQELPAGPVYPVVLNALRNAVESIRRRGASGRGGRVEVLGQTRTVRDCGATARGVIIEVRDNGEGLSPGADPRRAFEFGFTTKPGGSGIGLAVAKQIIGELGGTIELAARHGADNAPDGAILRLTFPVPADGE